MESFSTIGLNHYLVISAILFGLGLFDELQALRLELIQLAFLNFEIGYKGTTCVLCRHGYLPP